MLLIKHVVQGTTDSAAAAELLGDAHDTDSAAVTALLAHPWVSAWAAHCARDPAGSVHHAAVNAMALAAAARAGLLDRRITVSSPDGTVMIPTLGMLGRRASGSTSLNPADLAGPHWQPIRSIRAEHAGLRLELAIDDLDPYRDCHRLPLAARLSDDQINRLQRTFEAAWRILAVTSPARATELACGLVSLAPLVTERSGSVRSVTNADAFGGYAFTPHDDPAVFATTMVHEFQHSKLSALDSLVPLHDPMHDGRYFAPWRLDPRPLSGLLHGAYAFTAVAWLWHDLRGIPELEETATRRFALMRVQVWRALAALAASAGLTEAGQRLVSSLTGTMTHLMREPVPAQIEGEASRRLAEAELRWIADHPANSSRSADPSSSPAGI